MFRILYVSLIHFQSQLNSPIATYVLDKVAPSYIHQEIFRYIQAIEGP